MANRFTHPIRSAVLVVNDSTVEGLTRAGRYLRWGPFIVMATLSGIIALDRSPTPAAATWVAQFFLLLPAAAMVAAMGTRSRKGALLVGLATMGLMVALDFAPRVGPGAAGPSQGVGATANGVLMEAVRNNGWVAPGAIVRAARFLPGGAFLRGDPDEPFSLDSPVNLAAEALLKVAYLLMPLGLIGWSLAIESWMRRRVTFARLMDEFLARVVLDMAMAFGVLMWVFSTGTRAMYGIVILGEPAWTSTLPVVIVLLVGLPGWFRSRRDDPRGAYAE